MAIATATTTVSTSIASSSSSPIKGAYWFDQDTFPVSAVNTTYLTHVFFAFLLPSNTTYTLDITATNATSLAKFSTTLRSKYPPVKTLVSIGGAASNASLFAHIARNADARAAFIGSSILVARRFGFDGLDLDWEYPRNAAEMSDLAVLLRQWRIAILAESELTGRPPLLLTAAVYFAADFFLNAPPVPWYPVIAMNKTLDFINVMSYDLHGAWDNNTGAPAALFDPKGNVNVVYGLRSWIWAGMCPKKVVMGLPLYGKKWTLLDPNVTGIGSEAIGVKPESGGDVPYFQIEAFNKKGNVTVGYDPDTVSAYSYSGTSWVGYDDPMTVTAKIGFAQALGLRGYFFWAAGFDRDWKITEQASKAWVIT
ncbi:hypothetical protein PIB30_039952 [Stylosanthes scabra]|uniref:GH18 domain-containing protein n=1 Tax=Stylosanthes scabra TaxID=79078 RepID=A0ABU6TE45_9FABA|nr:hypothetical protein [Stylosanthes scabra]